MAANAGQQVSDSYKRSLDIVNPIPRVDLLRFAGGTLQALVRDRAGFTVAVNIIALLDRFLGTIINCLLLEYSGLF